MSSMQKLAGLHRKAAEHFTQLAEIDDKNRGIYVVAALKAAVSFAKVQVGSPTGRPPHGEQMVKLEVFVSSLDQAPLTKKAEGRLLESLRKYLPSPPPAVIALSYEDAAFDLLTVDLARWAINTADSYVKQIGGP